MKARLKHSCVPDRPRRVRPARRRIEPSEETTMEAVLTRRALELMPRGDPDTATLLKLGARVVLSFRPSKGVVEVWARLSDWPAEDGAVLGWVRDEAVWEKDPDVAAVRLAARELGWEVEDER